MEFFGLEIIALLLSPAVLLTAAAIALLLLSGIVANVSDYIEDVCYRWEARSLVQHPTAARYGTDVGAALEDVR
jgi:hypothetical protein